MARAEVRNAISAAVHSAEFLLRDGEGKHTRSLAFPALQPLMLNLNSRGVDLLQDSSNVRVKISNGATGLKDLLRGSETFRRFFDDDLIYLEMVGNYGFSLTRSIHLDEACSKIVKSVLAHSLESVADTLGSFLHTGTFPMTTVHLLKGTQVPEPIPLDASAQLLPYSSGLSIRPAWDLSPWPNIPTALDTAACALALRTDVRPGTGEERPDLRYSGVAEFGHDLICVILCLVSGKLFVPFAHRELVPDIYCDTLPMIANSRGVQVQNVEFPVLPSRQELVSVDSGEVRRLVSCYAGAPKDVQDRMSRALAWLRSATGRFGWVPGHAVDTHTGLEVLFGRAQRRFLPHRAAALYSDIRKEQKFAKRTVANLSKHRNDIVHGKAFQEQPELVEDAKSVLTRCLKWVASNQRLPPRWKRSAERQ